MKISFTSNPYENIIHIKPLSKYFDITLIRNFFDQTLKFDRFIDILSHQTHVKFLDRIYTLNPINKISNVWSGKINDHAIFDLKSLI
jgi:hypothetical protein